MDRDNVAGDLLGEAETRVQGQQQWSREAGSGVTGVFCVCDRGSGEAGSGATAVFCVGGRGEERGGFRDNSSVLCWW